MESHRRYRSFFLLAITFSCLVVNVASNPQWHDDDGHNWLNHGGNIHNRRYAKAETKICPSTASQLHLKWEFYTGNDVPVTPAIFEGHVYFPSMNGNIYAVNASDGSLVWQKNLYQLTGLNFTLQFPGASIVSRSTPTIAEDKLIVSIRGPAYVVALSRETGELIWKTQLETHPAAVVTMSGTYYEKAFYVGVSSLEEAFSIENCCTFRGSLAKLDIHTGVVLWKTYNLPDNHGQRGQYAGAAVWGSSPSIDAWRRHVYIATGNLYSAPQSIQDCQERQNNQSEPTHPDPCIEPDNHSNSIMAFDLDSGEIKWNRQLGGYDVFFLACANLSTPNCPSGPNPDADFGEAPMMLSIHDKGIKRDIVVAVQKSGFAWALDRDDGSLVWSMEAGPGGLLGGGTWGAATDEKRVYTNIVNSDRRNFTLRPSSNVTTGGGWVAMDAGTGRILWSTAVPNNATTNPVTIANGVLFAGSTYRTGPIYAINARTGEILWSYETGGAVYSGLSVSDGCVYVGNGYRGLYTPGTSVFAFCVD